MKQGSKGSQTLTTAAVYILLALAREDLHGYGIIQEITRQAKDNYRIGPGTLYDNLKKLMTEGLVIDVPPSERPDDDDRRFYRITIAGKAVLLAEVDRLNAIVIEARARLREGKPRRA
jgi:DNA-binding PadR family transcriptional regulator